MTGACRGALRLAISLHAVKPAGTGKNLTLRKFC